MFQLGRPDVWPVGDLGVRNGYRMAYELPVSPPRRNCFHWVRPTDRTGAWPPGIAGPQCIWSAATCSFPAASPRYQVPTTWTERNERGLTRLITAAHIGKRPECRLGSSNPADDRKASIGQLPKHHLGKARSSQEGSQLSRSVEPHVSRLQQAEEPISDAGRRQIGTGIADHEPAARSQDTSHLAGRLKRIRVVMERVRAEDGGELLTAERELLGVGDLKVDILDAVRETHGLLNHLGREIDSDDARGRGGSCPRCCTRSASHVEHPIRRGEIERGKRPPLNGIAPPGGETRFIAPGPTVEPSAG